jgi:hypothetical protein
MVFTLHRVLLVQSLLQTKVQLQVLVAHLVVQVVQPSELTPQMLRLPTMVLYAVAAVLVAMVVLVVLAATAVLEGIVETWLTALVLLDQIVVVVALPNT